VPISRAELERILVSRRQLRIYFWNLQEGPRRAPQGSQLLPQSQVDEILTRGLDARDDDELDAVALNPIALHDLYDEISERLPDRRAPSAQKGRDRVSIIDQPPIPWEWASRIPVGSIEPP
jgi:hypothetical protein